jgi:hypothetical protein
LRFRVLLAGDSTKGGTGLTLKFACERACELRPLRVLRS